MSQTAKEEQSYEVCEPYSLELLVRLQFALVRSISAMYNSRKCNPRAV